ncbi:UTP--glucose-1-phosphate uridylyltransferase [Feifania hominis]|uniref:UTP--glucose-1-phosphate uridylyltransferase n=1 Tax=Feifania hominis TaxID=2763660 RepID=A0A926HU43_9FIRM|nr:UTP--glucose-1-phosphate uridylyltransferase [Feifania hominis]MBC8536524.1 UTP--glucose-1-phosphate uridylyltransferase [Feifania hominis]
MKKVRKAVIPAAGLGTRVLPVTKSIPKEMLPIVDTPSIQFIVEEAVNSGIEEILIITNRGKTPLEDYFDHAVELEQRLTAAGKTRELESVTRLCNLCNIQYVRQKETRGLGHAVGCARSFVGDEPFVVLYGDDVILGDKPVAKQLIDAYEKTGKCVCGIKAVPEADIVRYSSLKVEPLGGRLYNVTDMIEKPRTPAEAYSLYSILGRVLLTPDIFDILERTAPGAGGEIQLTDAMNEIATTTGMTGVDFEGTRYDMGNKLSILQASIEVGLRHPEVGSGLRSYLKELAATL